MLQNLVPLGMQTVTLTANVVFTPTVPMGADRAIVQSSESSVFFHDDGTTPTLTNARSLRAGEKYMFVSAPTLLRFLSAAAGVVLQVGYYRLGPVDDGGGSLTVDGTVAATQGTSPWVVSATDLDIRNLLFATDKVDVSGSSVAATQGTSPWVVSATDLDIRNLLFATDKVDVSGSSVEVSNDVGNPLPVTFPVGTLSNAVQTSVTSAGQEIAPADATRKSLIITNSGPGTVVIGTTGLTATTGTPLLVNAVLIFSHPFVPTNAIRALKLTGGTATVTTQAIT